MFTKRAFRKKFRYRLQCFDAMQSVFFGVWEIALNFACETECISYSACGVSAGTDYFFTFIALKMSCGYYLDIFVKYSKVFRLHIIDKSRVLDFFHSLQ